MAFCQKLVKYTLFLTNFLIFVLGLCTLGFGIWVLVDKPGFLDLFDKAEDVINDQGGDISGFDIGVYASAPIILIVIAVIVTIIAFFGCCGAIKENKCMLITYFVILLALFIGMIVGAVLVLQGKFDDQIKSPLLDSIKKYKDEPTSSQPKELAFKEVWQTVQKELKCCGVNSAADWKTAENAGWENTSPDYPKPEGCCFHTRGQDDENSAEQITTCRKASYNGTDAKPYYFEGCYTVFIDEIESQQDKIFAVAITTVVIMFINMLSSFALCTMAGK